MPYWKQEFSTQADGELSASQDSLIVSILSAGTFFGALTAAPFGDFLGRRLGLIISAGVVFNLGVILQTASTGQPLFIAGRFFAGYGVGLVSALSKWLQISLFRPRHDRVGHSARVEIQPLDHSRSDIVGHRSDLGH
jgi:MFS family permease